MEEKPENTEISSFMAVITLAQLLECGVHFGHQTDAPLEPPDVSVHLHRSQWGSYY